MKIIVIKQVFFSIVICAQQLIKIRERYSFRGELRAVGDVLLDEIPLMLRCGFTSFDVSNEATLRALREGRLPRFPVAYQPGWSTHEARGIRPRIGLADELLPRT